MNAVHMQSTPMKTHAVHADQYGGGRASATTPAEKALPSSLRDTPLAREWSFGAQNPRQNTYLHYFPFQLTGVAVVPTADNLCVLLSQYFCDCKNLPKIIDIITLYGKFPILGDFAYFGRL